MSYSLRDKAIRHVKLSQLGSVPNDERVLIRITGNVRPNKTNPNELGLFDQFNDGVQIKKDEITVDLNYLEDFNLKDIHQQHDLVQFIGYPCIYIEGGIEYVKFKALYFRLIKRTSLELYYTALDIQENYLKSRNLI